MTVLDPRSSEFWQTENALLIDEMADTVLHAFLTGARNGAALLPAGLQSLVDWERFNEAAIRYLKTYNFEWVHSLNDTTRRQVVQAMDDWLREDTPLSSLQTRLEPIFGRRRAQTIAATETTRLFTAGNLGAWKSAGVVGAKRWMTVVQDVCPLCRPFHGMIVSIDRGWAHNDQMRQADPKLDKLIQQRGAVTALGPPLHPGCRCYLQPVLLDALSEEELAELDLAAGQLTGELEALLGL